MSSPAGIPLAQVLNRRFFLPRYEPSGREVCLARSAPRSQRSAIATWSRTFTATLGLDSSQRIMPLYVSRTACNSQHRCVIRISHKGLTHVTKSGLWPQPHGVAPSCGTSDNVLRHHCLDCDTGSCCSRQVSLHMMRFLFVWYQSTRGLGRPGCVQLSRQAGH